jgi:predicted CopG family antitoxin
MKSLIFKVLHSENKESHMSKVLTISDDLYAQLESTAKRRGLKSVEELLEKWQLTEAELLNRQAVVSQINTIQENLFVKYGEMPDSADLVHEDRER